MSFGKDVDIFASFLADHSHTLKKEDLKRTLCHTSIKYCLSESESLYRNCFPFIARLVWTKIYSQSQKLNATLSGKVGSGKISMVESLSEHYLRLSVGLMDTSINTNVRQKYFRVSTALL